MKKIILGASAILMLAACNVNYEKTPSGVAYKIFPAKNGEKLEPGKYVKFNMTLVLPEKRDSVFETTVGSFPAYDRIDTGKQNEYTFREVLTKCSVGDSGVAVLSIDTLEKKHALEYNDVFTKGGTLQFRFKILKAFKTENDVMSDYQNEMKLENARETKSVEDYMAKKGIKGVKTKSGAYVVVENPGGDVKADSGKMAVIKYKGYLQANDTVFDTNMDSSKGHPDAYNVLVGSHSVIPAWEEALPSFGKGGSGKVLVPAFLGYGPQGRPPVIPPNSNLIFDIQVLDVKDAPPPPKPKEGKGEDE
jgi:FKBP-type peptidyl-prolyl cis-trans isomerase